MGFETASSQYSMQSFEKAFFNEQSMVSFIVLCKQLEKKCYAIMQQASHVMYDESCILISAIRQPRTVFSKKANAFLKQKFKRQIWQRDRHFLIIGDLKLVIAYFAVSVMRQKLGTIVTMSWIRSKQFN